MLQSSVNFFKYLKTSCLTLPLMQASRPANSFSFLRLRFRHTVLIVGHVSTNFRSKIHTFDENICTVNAHSTILHVQEHFPWKIPNSIRLTWLEGPEKVLLSSLNFPIQIPPQKIQIPIDKSSVKTTRNNHTQSFL